jgi:hypothetical protein
MPDVTTINGRRIWMNHIDGDGFVSRAELPDTPLAAEVIRDRILQRHPVPHSVSVIEGEIGPQGLHSANAKLYEAVARTIYELPNVEPASHSYSHPFSWQGAASEKDSEDKEGYHLPIPGYRYDPEREILGSIDYVNRLLPPGKRCRLFFWTGDALPGKKELALLEESGYLNLNGGNTIMTQSKPLLSFVSPMARQVGPYLQIYAPVMNENDYTNHWTGPFYGFRQVIDTFQLTDKPRRLKPIDIYYHFYSGTKPASLQALEQVYGWAERQETTPVFASEYIPLVREFRDISIARRLDGTLQYRGIRRLRELRLLHGHIDLTASHGVAGMRRLHDGLYIHLNEARPVLKPVAGSKKPKHPYLYQANGRLLRWQPTGNGIRVRLRSHVPALLEVAGVAKACRLHLEKGPTLIADSDSRHHVRFSLKQDKAIDGTLVCR